MSRLALGTPVSNWLLPQNQMFVASSSVAVLAARSSCTYSCKVLYRYIAPSAPSVAARISPPSTGSMPIPAIIASIRGQSGGLSASQKPVCPPERMYWLITRYTASSHRTSW